MSRPLQIVLAGNPNVGKTTLYNALTGSNAKVTNYPGVTVDVRTADIELGPSTPGTGPGHATLTDLPGTYSLGARSPEEQIAIDVLAGIATPSGDPAAGAGADGAAGVGPDVVVVCVDASQPARSLYLLLQCQELGVRTVVAMTMVDEAKQATPPAPALAALLGCDVVAVNATKYEGLADLKAAIVRAAAAPAPAPIFRWHPSPALAARIAEVQATAVAPWPGSQAMALWALTSIDDEDELGHVPTAVRQAVTAAPLPPALDDEAVLGRWRWLDTHVPPLVQGKPDRSRTERVDKWLLHRGVGFAVFAVVMALLFMSLFTWSGPLMDGIESAIGALGSSVRSLVGDGMVGDFVVDGVIGGVGTVLVFLPQILLLFLFLGLLEDVGYLARVAYLMDRIMQAMNLHGRAFVPMLSGFACAVPAIMSTRTLERKRDRLLTMMVIPLMSCSARLPVYTLVITAMIPGARLTQGLLMVGLYLFSVMSALAAAWVLGRIAKPLRSKRLPFFVELPPYRVPRARAVVGGMLNRSWSFLREAGTVILVCSIALWGLLYFPRSLPAGSPDFAGQIASAPEAEKPALASAHQRALLENSYGGRLGKTIEPVIAPLGFDWKIGIGIIGSFAAREVFVATMGITVGIDASDDAGATQLSDTMRATKNADGTQTYSALVGFSLLIFFALACQCMSTLAVIRRESGSWKWPALVLGYMTVLAYACSLLVFQVGKLLGWG